MTLKGKAKQRAKEVYPGENYVCSALQGAFEEGYLACARENGFNIHYLDKDPTDLPKRDKRFSTRISIPVLTQDYIIAFYQFDDKKWYSQGKEVNVIAWCEIPQF